MLPLAPAFLHRRRSVLVGLGKSLAVIFQGAWLIQIAAVEFERERWLQHSCGML